MTRWNGVQKKEWTTGRRDSGELCLAKLFYPQGKGTGLAFIKWVKAKTNL
jgi:hypothetical protein